MTNINFHDIKDLLRMPVQNSLAKNIYWLGQRGEDAYPFILLFPLKGIICANWSNVLSEWQKHYDIHSLEQISQKRSSLSSLKLPLLLEWFSNKNLEKCDNKVIKILPYMAIEHLNQQQKILGPKFNLVKSINNKQLQRNSFQKWGLQTPKSLALTKNLNLSYLSKFLGTPERYIVTPNYGSLGKNVRLCTTDELLVIEKNTILDDANTFIVSEFIDGISVNTSIMINKNGIILGWPSVQILGEEISNAPSEFFFCGSNFSATHDFDKKDLTKLSKEVLILAENYARLGYLGFLGADWVLDKNGKWWLIEVNPRLQGSTLALSLFEIQAGYPCLLSFWDRKSTKVNKANSSYFFAPVFGFQLNIYARENTILENYFIPSANLNCRQSWYISGMPASNTLIQQSSEVFKIIAPNSSLSLNKNKLTNNERINMTQILNSIKINWKALTTMDE